MKCPSINEQGLLLHLDAGRRSSMPGSGLTYYGSSYWSHSGLNAWDASKINDGATNSVCFETDTAGVGSYLRFDGGTPVVFTGLDVYVPDACTCIWDVEYSDNDVDWSKAFVGLNVSAGGGWIRTTRWALSGAHRYWRLYKTNAAVAGGAHREVQFHDATWRDLSGNGYNATIYGATYSALNGGCMVFDGTDDYAQTVPTTFTANTDFTIMMWLKNPYAFDVDRVHIANRTNYGAQGIAFLESGSSFFTEVRSDSGVTTRSVTIVWPYTWTFAGLIRNSGNLYSVKNGVISSGTAVAGTITDSNNFFAIGAYAGFSRKWRGSIAQILVYQRALSAAEILQNYNATRGRFGL